MMDSIKRLRVIDEAGKQVLINFNTLLGKDIKTKYTLSGSRARSKSELCFTNFYVYFLAYYVLNYLEQDFKCVRHEADGSKVCAVCSSRLLWQRGVDRLK